MTDNISVFCDQLMRKFGSFVAVNQVSMEVREGEIIGFLGANGAGKTTLIRMLCGLLIPTSGKATVSGLDVNTQSEQIKQKIGYMSQKFSLYDDMTVSENLEFFGGIYDLRKDRLRDRIDTELVELGLSSYKDMITGSLPIGFKQRLALGCSIMHDPPILFLDEPTSGVDPKVRRSFWDIIYDKAALGKTIFVTTHFMDEAEYCNRVLIMHDGNKVAFSNPDSLKQKLKLNSMQEVFIQLIKPGNVGEEHDLI